MIISLMNDFQNVDSEWFAWLYTIGLIVAGTGYGLLIGFTAPKSYRQGQIDALNGKIKYEKKENKNGELVWEKKQTTNIIT